MENIKCWTDWMDHDDPTGTGDSETVSDLKTEYPKTMCPNPTAIEVASVDGISLADAGNVFYANDHITGLICKNADQERCFCRDYKVRFICHPPFCGTEKMCWTKWYDRDDPSGTGDWELLTNLQNANPGEICANPIAIESRTVDTNKPATLTGEDFLHYSPTTGLVCQNGPKQDCRDYKVRFGCPC
ncbi:cartilage intermediate layer protein 1-like isoform X2 [Alosa sapidissima]|uniref:cartilage intermediate layer protein 1-like isoform X2 n=1 Tax=Alosa sapidissima TaxID=34773 RepID=UPI001C0A6246|nr:cartilage intermediate layer protein 1-like isoform X2 [Alosa sapidissima]XP_041952225.1 cartilage intermediate layer protein 1-like isoform X2 [Alosa sapidissima]